MSVLLKAFFKKKRFVQMQQWYRGREAVYKLRDSWFKAACGLGNFFNFMHNSFSQFTQ